MNDIYNQMLTAYDQSTEQQKRNAVFEVNQQIILAGLYHGGFFDVAAFYGGTCLRIFHGLQRFSEDMDFSLLAPKADFNFSQYFQPIIDEFAMVGRDVEIKKISNILKVLNTRGEYENIFLDYKHEDYEIELKRVLKQYLDFLEYYL